MTSPSDSFDPEQPDLLPDLMAVVEFGILPAREVYPYIAAYEVRCAFCQHHQKHRRGWVVETDDGRRALCGIHCAAKHLGGDVVSRMQSGLSALERRMAQQRLLAPVLDGAPEVLAQLFVWESFERQIDSACSALRAATAGLHLTHFVTDAGTLDRERVETFDEPLVRRDGTTGTRKGQRRYLLGRTYGAIVLSSSGIECFRNARIKLEIIVQRCDDPKKINGSMLAYLAELRRDAMNLLGTGIGKFRAASQFFSEKNINEFSRWLSERHPNGLQAVWRANNGKPAIVVLGPGDRPLGSFRLPPLEVLPTEEALVGPLRRKSKRNAA